MNLKESYRYANYLDKLLETAYLYLRNKGFITNTQQEHMRKKANFDAVDETVVVQKPYDVEFTPMDVVDFAVRVLAEKEHLVAAIADAKSQTVINIDNAVAMNKKKQSFVNVLNNMANMKSNEKTVSGSAFKFNADGNQVKYFYDVKETTTIDFDRNNIRNLIKKYLRETDDISTKLDSIEINTRVNHDCLFDINDSFEDLLAG